MSQDSKVLSRAFLGIGLILLVISAIIFYYHFTFTKSAVHTEGIIVDAVWYNNHSNDVDDNGSWYPVVAFRPTPDYTLIFNSNIGSDFYEDSEGDRVNVYYPPGHPEQAEINNPWVNFFKRCNSRLLAKKLGFTCDLFSIRYSTGNIRKKCLHYWN